MSDSSDGLIERLAWDSSFFGVPIGRVNNGVGADQIGGVVREGQERGLRCVYLLASAESGDLVTAAEEHGFRVREIRMELQRPVVGHPSGTTGLRIATAADLGLLAPIARERIRGTRFFADRQFTHERAAELYVEWLRRGLFDTAARRVLVAKDNQGFLVCHLDSASGIGTIELVVVADDAAERGLGRALVGGADSLFADSSLATARVVTQGGNIAAQALYQACGYRTAKVFYWLHLWL